MTPDYGEASADRGVVHNLLDDHATAAVYFRHALENPARLTSPALARADLGWSLFHLKELVDAAKELRQAVQFQPNMCVATYRLARVYFARQEWEKAAELFQTVSEDPSCGSQEASLYLMKTRIQQGLVADVKQALAACLKMSPRAASPRSAARSQRKPRDDRGRPRVHRSAKTDQHAAIGDARMSLALWLRAGRAQRKKLSLDDVAR